MGNDKDKDDKMNEERLKNILENFDAPPVNENARKSALNLAMGEFDSAQNEAQKQKNKKTFQGLPFLSRLMGISNKNEKEDPMEKASKKRFIYGGMATAMAVVLVAGISVNQYMTESYKTSADLHDSTGFSQATSNVTTSVSTIPLLDAIKSAGSKKNKQDYDTAAQPGGRSMPILTAPEKQIADKKEQPSEERWRRIMSEREEQRGLAQNEPIAASAPTLRLSESKDEGFASGYAAHSKMVMPTSITVQEHDLIAPDHYQDVGRDQFEDFEQNDIKLVSEAPVSTFSVDVDTSSYSFIRRQINSNLLPQKDAVRIEEMINYFDYDYALPDNKEQPFASNVTVTPSPWKAGNKLIHIGIKGYDIDPDMQPRSNIVFLLDVSGSMNSPDKLPLVINSLKLALERLNPNDTVGVVVYAGAAGTVLEPTKVSEKGKIIKALENLSAGGSTAGAEGIRQAYNLAEENFDEEAVNRVILATDGDFNVGITNREELKDFVERKRETGIFLSVLGFGQGNLNDHMMQELAQNGNGVAAYIDTLSEARKVLVEEATSTLFPIAKDVKIQVDFNPDTVGEYRLIGYETRALNREDFNNDAVDAGDIGAGHTVTAIYEITPVDGSRMMDDSRYAAAEERERTTADTDFANEYAFLKIRYKLPNEDKSKLITTPVLSNAEYKQDMSETNWATAVAGFGQLLKGGKYTGTYSYDDVIDLAKTAKGEDEFGYRAEFIQLVRMAKSAAVLQKN